MFGPLASNELVVGTGRVTIASPMRSFPILFTPIYRPAADGASPGPGAFKAARSDVSPVKDNNVDSDEDPDEHARSGNCSSDSSSSGGSGCEGEYAGNQSCLLIFLALPNAHLFTQ